MTTFFKLKAVFLTQDYKVINLRLLTNKKKISKKIDCKTESKTVLIYIKKKIGKMRDLSLISVFISLSLFSYLLIIIWIFQLVRKNPIQSTRFLLISSIFML